MSILRETYPTELLMTRDEAIKACNTGALAACVSGVVTIVVVWFASSASTDSVLRYFGDPVNFVDVVLIFGLAYGVYRRSRGAAICLFVVFLLSKVYFALETGSATGLGVGVIFLYFLGKAIQGSFAFHRIEREENPTYKPTSRTSIVLGSVVGLLLIVLFGFGLLTMTSHFPSTDVIVGSKVSGGERDQLIEHGVLYPDETIEYFYSWGLTSIMEGGNVLSNRAVILYQPDVSGELQVYELTFDEILSVELVEEGGVFSNSLYKVNGLDPESWIMLVLSPENSGDEQFISALRAKLSSS